MIKGKAGCLLLTVAIAAIAAAPATAKVRHFHGTLTTDPESPSVDFDIVGHSRKGKFVATKIDNLSVLPDILYGEDCSKCVPPFRYYFPGPLLTPINVDNSGKVKGRFFNYIEDLAGDTVLDRYAFGGRIKANGTKASGRLVGQVSEGGLAYPHGEAVHRWRAHRAPAP